MELGKTLVGAIIGAAIGIAILIAVQHFRQLDQTWLAIIVALLVGLGVRAMVSTTGHPSYLRGALTGLLALAAYYGGTQLYSELATRGILAKKMQAPPPVAANEADGADGEAPETDAEADGVTVPVVPAADARPAVQPRDVAKAPMQPGSPWDYVWLTVAALLAYELGRGSEPAAPKEPVVPPPDAT
jgi:hypothetical protein